MPSDLTADTADDFSALPASRTRLRECPDCGLLQHMPPLPRGAAAKCPRCNAVLRQRRNDPVRRGLALGIASLVLFAIAATQPFLDLDLQGRARATNLLSGPVALEQNGMWELGAVVAATTFAVPLLRLLLTVWGLAGLNLPTPPRHLYVTFRLAERLRPWSMIEVFMLGVLVAYTKLVDIAHVDVGTALYALAALVVANAAADSAVDRDALWDLLESRRVTVGATPPETVDRPRPGLAGCECCGLVNAIGRTCRRCGASLHPRKPDSINRTVALLAAAVVLYVPANLLPVMTVIQFGSGAPSTILGGAIELAQAGMWPLAALVFFASITVPVLKIAGLTLLVITTARGTRRRLRDRTRLYRLIELFGRWSMIDVFMISILTALVQLGAMATILPGAGAISFCAVVILTMFASEAFDPRLMWDAAA